MKTLKIIFIVSIALLINACSEESVIEGLVPSKPIVVELNQEILSGTFDTSSILIDNDEYKLKTSYYRPNAIGEHQVYFELIVNNNRFIKTRRNINLALAKRDDIIDKTFFNDTAYSQEILLWGYQASLQQGGEFTFYSQNGSSFNNLLYIPFATGTTSNDINEKNVYGWLSVTVTKSKVTLHKIAYVKNTSILAGQED